MTTFKIKNIANGNALTHDSNATTWGELSDEVQEVHGNEVVRPGMKVKLRHNRQELAADSMLPTDMDEVSISLFATKLDAGRHA